MLGGGVDLGFLEVNLWKSVCGRNCERTWWVGGVNIKLIKVFKALSRNLCRVYFLYHGL